MRDLNYQLKQLCRRNRDGSFATQRDRERVLDLVANQLQEAGFRHLSATSLKPKHVEGLVARWQAEGLAIGTIKNRMAELRWWAEKIGKRNVIARDNHHYGIGNRQHVTNVSKARELRSGDLARVTDPYTTMSLRLQAAFGLRREESIKIRPEWADRGNMLALKDTWTKGGRAREVPVRNVEQRQLLEEAKGRARGIRRTPSGVRRGRSQRWPALASSPRPSPWAAAPNTITTAPGAPCSPARSWTHAPRRCFRSACARAGDEAAAGRGQHGAARAAGAVAARGRLRTATSAWCPIWAVVPCSTSAATPPSSTLYPPAGPTCTPEHPVQSIG